MGKKIRDKGEGSVFQRKDGKWIAEFRIGTQANGRPKIKSFAGKTEQEVKRRLKVFKTDFIKNGYTSVKKISVENYVRNWLYTIQIHDIKPKTFDRNECVLRHQISKYIGYIQLASLATDDIQIFINTLVEKGYSYSTIRRAYEILNGCFKCGLKKEEIEKNPCVGVVLPKNIKVNYNKKMKFFTDQQIEKIVSESTYRYQNGNLRYRFGYAVVVLLYTGMRISELIGLKWEFVNFEEKTIKIERNVVYVRNRVDPENKKFYLLEQNSTKSAAGERVVYINKKVSEALQELKKINSSSDYVMNNTKDKIPHPQNMDDMFRRILKRCDITPCGVHALRHTFASMLFKKGVDVKTVSELLGHSDVSITYNTYIHLIKEQKQQAVALLDEL